MTTLSSKARAAFAGRLRHAIQGDVLHDDFSRGRYATDASPYQCFPAAIALPKTHADLAAAIDIAWRAGLPVTARGGGTGRAGQAIGEGLVLDLSKYLTRLLYYDASAQTCIVEPGITPAALNEALRPERVWFPIEIGAALQATVGGMAATDAIGARTLLHGRMRDNITACDLILADGAEISFGEVPTDFAAGGAATEEAALALDLLEAVESGQDAVRRVPQVRGGHHGYNAAALLPGETGQNLAAFFAGSEGTLGIARRIELKLARSPRVRSVGVCHFASLSEAIAAVPRIMTLGPTDIELSARRIIELGVGGSDSGDTARRLLRKEAEALLLVEFMEGNRVRNAEKLRDLAELAASIGHPRAVSELMGPGAQEAARRAHRRGLARLYGTTDEPALFAPIDQIALPLEGLIHAADHITETLARHGLDVVWHGQIGVGALHLRPWLRVTEANTAEAARDAHAILASFGDRTAGVDGIGLARSHDLETRRDPRLNALFEALKTRLDPANRLNPGKIVLPPATLDGMIRKTLQSPQPHEGAASPELTALRCDGTALCRRLDKSVMCPSFKVTRNERDSPRGRANSLRLALTGELGAAAMASDAMAEAMSLCVSCKACRSECPRGVDIAQARIMAAQARTQRAGLSKFDLHTAYLPHQAPGLRRWRHFLNLRDLLPGAARLSERLTGVSADRPWPHWSSAPFSGRRSDETRRGAEVLLFPDTFNSNFDPVTLRSAVDVLEAAGFVVHLLIPPASERPYCCGRTFLEAGLLDEARTEARRLIAAVRPYVEKGVPLIGVEPACLLTIRDEFVNTLVEEGARELAAASLLFEEVMSQPFAIKEIAPRLHNIEAEALFAAHCHQQAFGTAKLARKVAGIVPGINVIEADPTCCGMGTSFGYRPDAVSVSLQMGEVSLFPQIRRASPDTLIIADGYSCRKQISDGTGRTARHTAVLLKLALAAQEKFGGRLGEGAREDRRLTRRLARLRRQYFR
jgi:FAD/FMN-containing dehydrogenase/Fe-S oxidoreductase